MASWFVIFEVLEMIDKDMMELLSTPNQKKTIHQKLRCENTSILVCTLKYNKRCDIHCDILIVLY